MIDKGTILKVSRIKGIRNMDHACKDYFQEIILLAVSRELPHLVFKGGTCLYKFHGLDRFSEDLDLNGKADKGDLFKLRGYLSDLGYSNDVETRTMTTGLLSTFKVKGFLYNGSDVSLTRVRTDITVKDLTVLPVKWSTVHSLYPDIPTFTIGCMDEREILAEKFRALFQRSRSRDLYDIGHLIDRGTPFDPDLLREKLASYSIMLEITAFALSLSRIGKNWERELSPFVERIPSFEERRNLAVSCLEGAGLDLRSDRT